jgi:hypothetical protein
LRDETTDHRAEVAGSGNREGVYCHVEASLMCKVL